MSTKKLNFFALFILFGLSISLKAQDLIVTTEGDSLNCKITKVETDFIYFSINKDGGVLNTLLPMGEIRYYKYKFYPTSALPVDAEVEGPKDFPRFRLAVNGGWSYRLSKVADSVSPDLDEYIRELKSGFSYGADVTYYWSRKAGIGAKYDVFRSKNDIQDPQAGTISDDISIRFIGPYYSSRFLAAKKKNSLFMNIGLGYVGYKDEAFFLGDYDISGSSAGLLFDIGYDIGLSRSFAMGFQLSFLGGTLTQYKISDGFTTETVELEEGSYEGMARINLSVGLRLIK